jgi:hypothetical protein
MNLTLRFLGRAQLTLLLLVWFQGGCNSDNPRAGWAEYGSTDANSDNDSDGDADGDGDSDGDSDGDTDGDADGDGDGDGDNDGDVDGDSDGDTDGDADGDSDGDSDGDADGDNDGDTDADSDADSDADTDGDTDGDGDTDADGDSDGDTDDTNHDDNSFDIEVSVSPKIRTVGIVEWSVDSPVDEAVIRFGRDSDDYEYEALVGEPEGDGYRTWLLGMKPDTTYYFEIAVNSGNDTLTSEVQEVTTGPIDNGMPSWDIQTQNESALYGAFTINCYLDAGIAFILDKDGEYVWWYQLPDATDECSHARMSFDGKYMWAGNFSNVTPDGALSRVTMDGLEEDVYTDPALQGRHHDFAILPNGNILMHVQANGGGYGEDGNGDMFSGGEGPDIIQEFDPETGQITDIYHENDDFAPQIEESGAHTNYLTYVPHLNAISFSLRHTSTIALISYPEGELIDYFGGPNVGYGIEWNAQHGHHFLSNGHLLIFNNDGPVGSTFGSSSYVLEFDINNNPGTQVFEYNSGNTTTAFGDAHRLPNGNTFITYSMSGLTHEIDANGTLLRSMTVNNESIGYSNYRKSLYGPPPPWSEDEP